MTRPLVINHVGQMQGRYALQPSVDLDRHVLHGQHADADGKSDTSPARANVWGEYMT